MAKTLAEHNYNGIDATVIAHSKNPQGREIVTWICTFPRIILAEVNTHRLFSRNSASSRAIPFEKMVAKVKETPFVPMAWQADHKGMQGTEYIANETGRGGDLARIEIAWETAIQSMVSKASWMNDYGLTKQLCNRLLEPFLWHTAIITSTELENFFNLRCPQYQFDGSNHIFKSKKDVVKKFPENSITTTGDDSRWKYINKGAGEIHIMELAEKMWDTVCESTPKDLLPGEFHIPFGDFIDTERLGEVMNSVDPIYYTGEKGEFIIENMSFLEFAKAQIAVARCARVSYLNFEGKDDYKADMELFSRLFKMKHMSPFEHVAFAMSEEEENEKYFHMENGKKQPGWCRNFRGFIQYRSILD